MAETHRHISSLSDGLRGMLGHGPLKFSKVHESGRPGRRGSAVPHPRTLPATDRTRWALQLDMPVVRHKKLYRVAES